MTESRNLLITAEYYKNRRKLCLLILSYLWLLLTVLYIFINTKPHIISRLFFSYLLLVCLLFIFLKYPFKTIMIVTHTSEVQFCFYSILSCFFLITLSKTHNLVRSDILFK